MNFKTFIEQEDKINDIMNKHGLILFFHTKNGLFGSPEESRIAFARLKNDAEEPNEEARFTGIDLLKSLFGGEEDPIQSAFGREDIPNIKVCDREEAIKHLINHKPKKEKK